MSSSVAASAASRIGGALERLADELGVGDTAGG